MVNTCAVDSGHQIEIVNIPKDAEKHVDVVPRQDDVPNISMKCIVTDKICEQPDNMINCTVNKLPLINVAFKRCTLKHVGVEIVEDNGVCNIYVNALVDSGTEMPVVSKKVLSGLSFQEVGSISVQGVTGAPVLAKLIVLHMRLHIPKNNFGNNENIGNSLPIMCALVENVGNNEQLLLHPEIIAELESKTQNIINPVIAHVITTAQSQKIKE